MKVYSLGVLGCVLLGNAAFAQVERGSLLCPVQLTCEGSFAPVIDVTHPTLSWKFALPGLADRGQSQSAYQVLVASTPETLAAGLGDRWDSGKVASAESTRVYYHGKPLVSHAQYFWKVRIWDCDGRPSTWSDPSRWTIGVLATNEWQAKWIGTHGIGNDWTDYVFEARFTVKRGAAGVLFRARSLANAYFWQVTNSAAGPLLKAQLLADGACRVLKEVRLNNVAGGNLTNRPHRLRIELDDTRIKTFFDDQLVDTLSNRTCWHGTIGFCESPGDKAVFHSVTVTGVDGTVLFQNDFNGTNTNSFAARQLGAGGLEVSGQDILLPTGVRTPLLRREFELPKPVLRAWLYATALGLYELRLNGQRVGEDLLTPGWTDYHTRLQYQTYDVTGLLKVGTNAIGALLGPGWFAGNLAWFGPNHYGDAPQLFAQLHVEFVDHSTQVIASDESWKLAPGPSVSADNLDGEIYDARLEHTGWDQPGFDDSKWRSTSLYAVAPPKKLVAQADPPVRVVQEIHPVAITAPQPGVYIFDIGQNIAGIARLRVQGPAGTLVKLRFGERLNYDGTLATKNLNKAKATDEYTLKGGAVEVWQPRFTFHGFQYVEVTGYPGRPSLDAITGLLTVTAVPEIGKPATSNELLNRIWSNLYWGGRDAFLSIPMDSPQRSERLGWTGDACFYVASAAFNFDMARFYAKWETDITEAQTAAGLFPNVAPNFLRPGGYGGGWGDAGVVVPYVIWQHHGDTNIIRENYSAMARWIEYLRSKSKGLILPTSLAQAGDWLNVSDETPHDFIATAYFAYDTVLLSRMAAAIGKPEDAAKYAKLFEEIRQAFIEKYVSPDATVSSGSQTAYVMALHIGLLPEILRAPAMEKLVQNIRQRGTNLSTGFVGTQWLWPVLTAGGQRELAYGLLEKTNYPSYGYMIQQGATTIWEAWNSVNPDGSLADKRSSLNHSAMASAGEWMFQTIGGIVPDSAHPGFKHFVIHPQPGGGVSHASVQLESPYGLIATSWRSATNSFTLDVTVPVNTTASICLPVTDSHFILEGGQPVANAAGIRFEQVTDGATVFRVGSGQYHFQASLKSSTP